MEELLPLTARCGLDLEEGEAVVGALLSVLKKSPNLKNTDNKDDDDDDVFEKQIMQGIPGSHDVLKKHERQSFRKKLPNPAMMLLPRPDFAPPGPPPPVILKAAATGIQRAMRKDKDASRTEDAVKELVKSGIEKDKILTFIPVFILYVQEKTGTDISLILRLPPEEEKDESSGVDDEKTGAS